MTKTEPALDYGNVSTDGGEVVQYDCQSCGACCSLEVWLDSIENLQHRT